MMKRGKRRVKVTLAAGALTGCGCRFRYRQRCGGGLSFFFFTHSASDSSLPNSLLSSFDSTMLYLLCRRTVGWRKKLITVQ